MKIEKKEIQLKKFRQAEERIQEIYREMNNAPAKKLPKKIFAGHWRYISVRADILRSSIGEEVSQVIALCNHWVLGKKKYPETYRCSTEVAFARASNKTEEDYFGRNANLLSKKGKNVILARISEQLPNPISEEAMEKSGLSDKIKRKWFDKVVETIPCGTKTYERIKYFPKIPKYMLEFSFKPAYITEVKDTQGDLESELTNLKDFMDKNNGWAKLHGNFYDEWDMSLSKKKKLEKIKNKELNYELNDI
jgi:hypothetical protein